jgi:membrane associated rhomboid family serine protease
MVKWTFVLIIACVVVFILQLTNIFDLKLFAFTPALASERPWTFITSIFLHATHDQNGNLYLGHIFLNMFVLFFLGITLENKLGTKRFLLIYFLSGIAGSLGYMITATNSLTPAVGASGAIYGILGTLVVLMPFLMVWIWGLIPVPLIVVAILWGLIDFFGLFSGGSGIAHGAHLGGLFVGVIFGVYLKLSERKRAKARILSGYNWEVV